MIYYQEYQVITSTLALDVQADEQSGGGSPITDVPDGHQTSS